MKILNTDIPQNYLSKFHKYGSYNFFSKQTSTYGYPPPPLSLSAFVHFCLTPLPRSLNVRTSSMDGLQVKGTFYVLVRKAQGKVLNIDLDTLFKDV